jgi:saxitoxin biosynthesis operon SxtJ-like protein
VSIHEPVHDEEVVGPSDRSFGVVFTVIFSLVGLLPLWRGAAPRWWAVSVALVVGLLALLWPRALTPANRVWLRIGLLLHKVVNPIVMGVIFYLVVTPFAYVMRRYQQKLTEMLRPSSDATTYWISRADGSSPMDQQF